MSCPLCAHSKSRPSWLGSTVYLGEEFRYVECLSCKSLYCDPMPDGKTLERMYGPEYHDLFHAQENMGGTSGVTEVLSWLRREGRGKFVDYGCGAGHLLHAAKLAEWNAIGIEFEENVATRISQRPKANWSGAVVTTCLLQSVSEDFLKRTIPPSRIESLGWQSFG